MGFSSIDALVNEMTTNGKYSDQYINKITGGSGYAAGRWYDFSSLAGAPVANAWAGTALAWRACTESAGNGTQIFGIPHGGDVSPATKHLINMSAISAVATAVPGYLMLVDIQGYYPGISLNSATAQTLTGTPAMRYTKGIRPFLVTTTGSGATAHNVAMSYTNDSAVAGRSLPVTVSCTASAIVGHITHSGTAASNYGPFLPLASGDTGVNSVQTVTISAASGSGAGALVLAKPLAKLPITTAGVAAERDLLNQMPSLPQIKDGACLAWLYFAGAATAASTNFFMTTDFVWGNS